MILRADGLRACVSGSFRKAMVEVAEAVYTLTDMGVNVLSPADPRIVGAKGEFLFVASDKLWDVKAVQRRHLDMIAQSDFLWLAAPEGYVGASAAMEIGHATAHKVPIFATCAPSDIMLKEFVVVVSGLKEAVARVRQTQGSSEAALRKILSVREH